MMIIVYHKQVEVHKLSILDSKGELGVFACASSKL